MTPQELIATARYILNDLSTNGYRQSDAELLGYVNDGILEISSIRPERFSVIGDHICTTSKSEQNFSNSTAQAVVKVVSIKNGDAVTMFDIDTMDAFNPPWRVDTPAATAQWAAYPGDPLRFFVYPPAPATTQTLSVLYVKIPTVLLIGDSVTEIPASMYTALTDYVVYRASLKDDEHSSSGRATAEYTAFVNKIKGV